MSLLSLFKLEKLTITSYSNPERTAKLASFAAMFNPSTYSEHMTHRWKQRKGISTSIPELDYRGSRSGELSFTLLLDNTGADALSYERLLRDKLDTRLKNFKAVAYSYKGTIHQPAYLTVAWGSLTFECRLSKADIKYTLFDRDGTPMRAEIAVTFTRDMPAKAVAQEESNESPDMTHARIVRHGDTLPLLTRSIYGSSASYLDVARFNNLDDFRNLEPGRQLLFPPLATFSTPSSKGN